MGNKNSAIKKAQGGEATKVTSTEPQYVPMQRKPSKIKAEVVGLRAFPEQHGKKPLDDDTFTDYIRSVKHKIRSFSNIGRHEEHRNPVPDHVPNDNNNNKKEENERDHFSDFIHNAKKKFKTVSSLGKNNSFRRG